MSPEGVAAVIAAITFVWYVYTTRRGWINDLALSRAEFIRGYTQEFYSTDGLVTLFLEIEHHRYTFDSKTERGTKREIELSHLLDFLNTVGMSAAQGIINLDDLKKTTIGYAVMVTWDDRHVQSFLDDVDGTDQAKGLETIAFAYFRQLGALLKAGTKPTRWDGFKAKIQGSAPALPTSGS